MRKGNQKLNSQSGVTLVELMVVVLIIAIVCAIAVMNWGKTDAQFQRQNAARELKTAFERARFDSVKRRADNSPVPFASVTVAATGFTLTTDVNQDGTFSASDSVTTQIPAGVTIAARSGLSLPLTISFNRRGEPDVANPEFVVCNGTCDFNNASSSNANVIYVTATGTVNMLPGGSAIPTFNAPGVQVVPGGTSIRSETFITPSPTP